MIRRRDLVPACRSNPTRPGHRDARWPGRVVSARLVAVVRAPPPTADHAGVRISLVVLFFEILLILAAVLITWFGVYTLYRLVTDES